MTPLTHPHNIRSWLHKIKLEHLSPLFEKEKINAKTVLECIEADLIKFGINNEEERRLILQRIEKDKHKGKIINRFFVLMGLLHLSVLFLSFYALNSSGISSIENLISAIAANVNFVDTMVIFSIFQGILLLIYQSKAVDVGINVDAVRFNKLISFLFLFSFFYVPIAGIIILVKDGFTTQPGFYVALSISLIMLIYMFRYSFIYWLLGVISPGVSSSSKEADFASSIADESLSLEEPNLPLTFYEEPVLSKASTPAGSVAEALIDPTIEKLKDLLRKDEIKAFSRNKRSINNSSKKKIIKLWMD